MNGAQLIAWGFTPGPTFPALLAQATQLAATGHAEAFIIDQLRATLPVPRIRLLRRPHPAPCSEAIALAGPDDAQNIALVRRLMAELLRTPVITRGAVMPDACPAGAAEATIPVGGAIAVENAIIPSAHSADICCSMQASFFPLDGKTTSQLLDILRAQTRFGAGGRKAGEQVDHPVLHEPVWTNPFLQGLQSFAHKHMADQGDGNHFAFLGQLDVTAELLHQLDRAGYATQFAGLRPYANQPVAVLVTHHGSRGLGAQLYKRGQQVALQQTAERAEGIPAAAAWIDYTTPEGQHYWEALQYIQRWTQANHDTIHARFLAAIGARNLASVGNAHNFVWRRGSTFLHGKGATPAWRDAQGRGLLGLVPLNMAAPILLVLGRDNDQYLSFCPHGAGRNYSRSHTLKKYAGQEAAAITQATAGIDVRWYYGKPDLSETPLGYKSAAQVQQQITDFGLATVLAEIKPMGCIMAGDSGPPPWQTKRAARPN